jgi:hypothetical protein
VPALPPPSATGVRVAGDTYQWLYVWEGCVQAYKDALDGVCGAVVAVGVEVAGAGNLDDVVYYYADGKPTRYAQVKYAADASTAVGEEYLFKQSAEGGPSILQKITRSWQTLTRNGEQVQLALLTTRSPDPADVLFKGRDTRTGLLRPRADPPDASRQPAARRTGDHDRHPVGHPATMTGTGGWSSRASRSSAARSRRAPGRPGVRPGGPAARR